MVHEEHATLALHVVEARALNPLIRMFRLRTGDGSALPGYTAGAHVRVRVELPDGSHDWRHYSLINPEARQRATDAPADYVIAVRREDDGETHKR